MKLSEKITIILGIALVAIFVIGLAWSISTGLAGFWRGPVSYTQLTLPTIILV